MKGQHLPHQKKQKRLFEDKLIDKKDLNEEIKYIKDSENAYISPNGNIYLQYQTNKFYKLKSRKLLDYVYIAFKLKNGKRKNFRVHRLIAQYYIPNPKKLPIVGHKNDIKDDNRIENLYWTTTSENTKKAYNSNAINNTKSWEDSQSIPIAQFDLNYNFIRYYGSTGEASRENGVTKTTILEQCKHHCSKSKPRKGYYYRYKEEFDKLGFVL